MKVTILCSNPAHPVYPWLEKWAEKASGKHEVKLVSTRSELEGGDFLFLVSCSELIGSEYRSLYRYTLVLHASDLPQGRGWSPHVWEIIRGADYLTLSLLEAEDKVDSGRIWLKKSFPVSETDLWHEVNERLFAVEVDMIDEAVNRYTEIMPYEQPTDVGVTYYRQRTPDDSEIDPEKSISQQFDLIRMCDPERYPATFKLRGQKYKLRLEKMDHENDIN